MLFWIEISLFMIFLEKKKVLVLLPKRSSNNENLVAFFIHIAHIKVSKYHCSLKGGGTPWRNAWD